MQPQEPKSIGGALVDVFDAALSLVKAELRTISRRVGDVVKAKGLGVVLLLAAAAPLSLALIFLILAVYFGLIALGLPAWASALIIAVVALVVTGVLVMMGIRRLSAEVKDDSRPADVRAREEAEEAQKRLEQAEKQYEKGVKQGEKKVEKAERDYERAQRDLVREEQHASGGAPYASTGPASYAATGAPSPSSSGAPSHSGHTRPAGTPPTVTTPPVSAREEEGIPVSTKPQLDQEDRK